VDQFAVRHARQERIESEGTTESGQKSIDSRERVRTRDRTVRIEKVKPDEESGLEISHPRVRFDLPALIQKSIRSLTLSISSGSGSGDERGSVWSKAGSGQSDPDKKSRATVLLEKARKHRRQIFYRRERIVAALLGSTSFLVPMLIMSIKPSKKKSLITSNVCIVVVAMFVA